MNRRELRREAKRQRSGKFGPRPAPAPAAAAPAPATPPAGIPILWVEPTGKESSGRYHYCETCKLNTVTIHPREEWDEGWPDPRPTIECRQCREPVTMNGKGLNMEYQAPSTGEVFETQRDLPVGAVWAQRPWRAPREGEENNLRNWISHVDADGRPFPPPKKGEGGECRMIERLHADDGRVLVCKLPDGHDWVIDSRCNNCTLPLDDEHWCWNRSGRPEDGTLDVRKGKPGQTTCAAGGGSIQTGRWHGFLHGGRLVSC